LVNLECRLPTRDEFNEFLTGKSEVEVSREEIAELLQVSDREVNKVKARGKAASARV